MALFSGRTWALGAALLLTTPLAATAAENAAQGISLGQQSPDQWRASKLIGVPIYGPDNKSVGKITDVLMSHDGGAQDIIVGVGGFLGIGEKDVAIPFSAVNFNDKPIPVAVVAPTNNLSSPPTPDTGTMAVTTGGTAAQTGAQTGTMAPATPGLGLPVGTTAATNASPMGGTPAGDPAVVPSTAYPDHGTIAFTADQLKSAPTFKFAR